MGSARFVTPQVIYFVTPALIGLPPPDVGVQASALHVLCLSALLIAWWNRITATHLQMPTILLWMSWAWTIRFPNGNPPKVPRMGTLSGIGAPLFLPALPWWQP